MISLFKTHVLIERYLNINLRMGSINFILPVYLTHYQNETFAISHPHIPFQKLLQMLRDKIKDTVCLLSYL